eukprot:1999622-Rhodomonas_salina.1
MEMSPRDASPSPTLRFRGSKLAFFADGLSSKFSLTHPELSTIVEESVEDCDFLDDPGELCLDIETEIFALPGKQVRGGGDKLRTSVKKI